MLSRFAPLLLILAGCGGGGAGPASPRDPFRVTALGAVGSGFAYGIAPDGTSVTFGFEGKTLVVAAEGGAARRIAMTGGLGFADPVPQSAADGRFLARYEGGALVVEEDGRTTRLPGRQILLASGPNVVSKDAGGLFHFANLATGTEVSLRLPADLVPLQLAGSRLLYRRAGTCRIRSLEGRADAAVATPAGAEAVSPDCVMDSDGDVLGSATFADGTRLFLAKDGAVSVGPLVAADAVPTALGEKGDVASYTAGGAGYLLAWGKDPQRLTCGGQAATTGLTLANGPLTRGMAVVGGVRTSLRVLR